MTVKIGIISCLVLFMNLSTSWAQSTEKVSVLWVDPLESLDKLTTRRGILDLLNKARNAGFQAIALGIKANNGQVLYESKIAPRLLEWKGKRVPLDFDLVGTFIDEGRRRQLQVYALFPVLAEGRMRERSGTLYQEHPDWQASVYVVENETPQVIPITQWGYGPVAYASPLNNSVQNYEITILEEFLQEHNVDGIILDKLRFSGIESDFSDAARSAFEAQLGEGKIDWWPEDVMEWQYKNESWQPVPGKLFTEWVKFRSRTISSFVTSLVNRIKGIDPTLPVGNVVGSWYPTYYEYGVNWASETNVPDEHWAADDYNETAIAEKLDYSVVGCFFPRVTIQEAESVGAEWWMSVEGGATLAMDIMNKTTPVYAAILAGQFKDNGDKFKESLETALSLTNGLYVTDASHITKYDLWDEISAVLIDKNDNKRELIK